MFVCVFVWLSKCVSVHVFQTVCLFVSVFLCVFACGQFVSVRIRGLVLCIFVYIFSNETMTEPTN